MLNEDKAFNKIARAGLIAKGIVYVLLGIIGFMAAFELGNQANKNATSKGVFNTIDNLPGGKILLIILAAGLICYTIWRFIQAAKTSGSVKKKWGKRIRYVISGLAYGFLAFTAIKIMLHTNTDNGDNKQELASELLQQSYGQVIAIIVALIFAVIGGFQIYYGLAEKFKKHISSVNTNSNSGLLYKAAKIGYVSRGIVWLIIAYLFINAALHSNSSEAGDTGKAFEFIEATAFGSWLLGILAVGVIMYGIYNFIRAGYDKDLEE